MCNILGSHYVRRERRHLLRRRIWTNTSTGVLNMTRMYRWRKSCQLKHLTLTVSSNSLANCWFVRMSSSLSVFLWTAVIIWKKFGINLQLNYYIICQIILIFLLVLNYDNLEDRCIDNIINIFFASLLYKMNKMLCGIYLLNSKC